MFASLNPCFYVCIDTGFAFAQDSGNDALVTGALARLSQETVHRELAQATANLGVDLNKLLGANVEGLVPAPEPVNKSKSEMHVPANKLLK